MFKLIQVSLPFPLASAVLQSTVRQLESHWHHHAWDWVTKNVNFHNCKFLISRKTVPHHMCAEYTSPTPFSCMFVCVLYTSNKYTLQCFIQGDINAIRLCIFWGVRKKKRVEQDYCLGLHCCCSSSPFQFQCLPHPEINSVLNLCLVAILNLGSHFQRVFFFIYIFHFAIFF